MKPVISPNGGNSESATDGVSESVTYGISMYVTSGTTNFSPMRDKMRYNLMIEMSEKRIGTENADDASCDI
jgi:hypothetical protein